MSWESQIMAGGPLWSAVEAYADQRKADLLLVCADIKASEADIRQAQAGILELDTLLDQPKLLKQRAKATAGQPREGY